MPKNCSLCIQPENIKKRLLDLKIAGNSPRKIETILADEFNVEVSYSAIGRHLKGCVQKEASLEPLGNDELENLAINPPNPQMLHHALVNLLALAIRQCHTHISEKADLEVFRGLEVLVNIRDKLYPQKQGVDAGESFREKSMAVLDSLTEEEKRTLIAQDRH